MQASSMGPSCFTSGYMQNILMKTNWHIYQQRMIDQSYFPNTYHFFFVFPGSTIPCQDGSSKKETKKKAKRRLSFASEDEQVEIKAENPPGDKKTKETSAMSEDEAERLVKEMMKGSGSKAADAEDSDSASEKRRREQQRVRNQRRRTRARKLRNLMMKRNPVLMTSQVQMQRL